MLDNIQVAILSRVNELAARFGLKPHEFVAVIDNASDKPILRFEVPVSGNSAKEKRFSQMLDLLKIADDSHELKATAEEIVDTLDNALKRAPKQRQLGPR
ncbi:MAG TPA: hypothetical protein VE988_15985 [Gemmataceae bacterium]|nr:hypothetical protein [Gemmataceae bacterium]